MLWTNWNARKISARKLLLDAIEQSLTARHTRIILEKLTMYMLPLTEKQAISVYMPRPQVVVEFVEDPMLQEVSLAEAQKHEHQMQRSGRYPEGTGSL